MNSWLLWLRLLLLQNDCDTITREGDLAQPVPFPMDALYLFHILSVIAAFFAHFCKSTIQKAKVSGEFSPLFRDTNVWCALGVVFQTKEKQRKRNLEKVIVISGTKKIATVKSKIWTRKKWKKIVNYPFLLINCCWIVTHTKKCNLLSTMFLVFHLLCTYSLVYKMFIGAILHEGVFFGKNLFIPHKTHHKTMVTRNIE